MTEDRKIRLQQKKNKIFSLISIAVFLTVLIMPGMIWGIGMLLPGEGFKTLDYDLGEKRNKEEFPQQLTSAYGTELEEYYNDRLPFRSVIITANRKLTAAFEKPYDETISPYLVKLLYNNTAAKEEETEQAQVSYESIDIKEETPEQKPETPVPNKKYAEEEKAVETVEKEQETEETTVAEKEQEVEETENAEQKPATEETDIAEQEPVEVAATEEQTVEEIVPAEEEEIEEPVTGLDMVKKYAKEPVPNYALDTGASDFLPPKILNNLTIVGRDGWLFFTKENALEDYIANNILSEAQMKEYLNGMIRLRDLCTAQGKKVYFFIPPNKEQVYAEKMPSYQVADSYKRAQRLVDYVHANSDIQIIYPINEMKAAKGVCQPYFKTDTHWTEAGAYVGTQALYGMMGMPVTDIQNVSKTANQYLGGDLLLLGNLNQDNYADDIRYQINYKPEINVSSVNGKGFADYVFHSASSSANQCKIVVVGDSFRLFMSQYISKDFSDYAHVHWEHLGDPEAADLIRNADIIVMESVERLNNYLPQTMNGVSGILQQ